MATRSAPTVPTALRNTDLAVARHGRDGQRWLDAMWEGDPLADAVVADFTEHVGHGPGMRMFRTAIAEGIDAVGEGVYWQTLGPRLETPAEIRFVASHADVIGMTVATECVVAGDLGLRYAALCVVDNLANGLAAETVSTAGMEADRLVNAERLREGLAAVLPRLGAVGR